MAEHYPKPGPVGGLLIREVIRFLRGNDISLPLASHILIAISGGSDSVGLAHLLIHYGRRVIAREKISLLHINHNWRGAESDGDAAFVKDLASRWEVPLRSFKFPRPEKDLKQSLEEHARMQRKSVFQQAAESQEGMRILTAHQADDLAETVLWRVLSGGAQTHGAGILVQDGAEIRPFLRLRKQQIQDYLREEGQGWREDQSNQEERFLRAQMRAKLMPEVERLFPRAVRHLGDAALQLQKKGVRSESRGLKEFLKAPGYLFDIVGLRARKAHWKTLEHFFEKGRDASEKEMHLPGGWRLIQGGRREEWTLTKLNSSELQKNPRDPE